MSCFTVLLGLFLVATPATAQIPTTDAASLAQLMQQVQNGLHQINQLQSQIGLQTDQLQAQQAQLQAQQSMVQGLGKDFSGGNTGILQQSARVLQDLRSLQSLGQEMKLLLEGNLSGANTLPLAAILQRIQQLTQAQQAIYQNAATWQNQVDQNQLQYGAQVQQAVGARCRNGP